MDIPLIIEKTSTWIFVFFNKILSNVMVEWYKKEHKRIMRII